MKTIKEIIELTKQYKKIFQDKFEKENFDLFKEIEEQIINEAKQGSGHLLIYKRYFDSYDNLSIYDLETYYKNQGYSTRITDDTFQIYWFE